MWNVLKFFFVWFWLTVASVAAWYWLSVETEPKRLLVQGRYVAAHPGPDGVIPGLIMGFFMCIPAYFLARPKAPRLT